MIKGTAHLTLTHETLVLALQEYMQRHFAAGSCPTVSFIAEIRHGVAQAAAEARTFSVQLTDEVARASPTFEGPVVRAGRRLDMEA